jgi:hypothetical protein
MALHVGCVAGELECCRAEGVATGLKHPLMSGIADAGCACDPSAGTRTRAWTTPRKAAVSPLQPYTSKEEAQSATPDSWAGYAA